MNNDYLYRAKQAIPDVQVLSVVAAKRARQLAHGSRPMIKCKDENVLDIALLEIAEGLLTYSFGEDDAEAAASPEAAEVQAAEKAEEA
ncbi:MAG: DNA-directed RNA polymerase subunit omega [Lentisphaeria bacterium]|nr:DNA-directed RNA polymerase subunit omega [Lentisphaeria bacterium]